MNKISGSVTLTPKTVTSLSSGGCYGKLRIKYTGTVSLYANVYVGNDGNGSVSPISGYQLDPGESIEFSYVELLSDIKLYLDSSLDPETDPNWDNYVPFTVSWIILGNEVEK